MAGYLDLRRHIIKDRPSTGSRSSSSQSARARYSSYLIFEGISWDEAVSNTTSTCTSPTGRRV